jgi:hypothetical protein
VAPSRHDMRRPKDAYDRSLVWVAPDASTLNYRGRSCIPPVSDPRACYPRMTTWMVNLRSNIWR